MTPIQLKAFRKRHKLAQTDLAAIIKETTSSVSRMEQGTRPITEKTWVILQYYEQFGPLKPKQKKVSC